MMELTEQDIKTLEGYWSNGLTAAEMSATRTRLEADADFKDAATQYQKMAILLEMQRTKAWLSTQREQKAEKSPHKTSNTPLTMKQSKIPVWAKAAAASATILLIGGYYYFDTEQTGPVDKFFMASFDPPPPVELNMSKLDEEKATALRYYDSGEYKKAIPLLEKVVKEDNKDSLKLYYLSLCYIAENKPQSAIPILKNMLYSTKAHEPEWFLALAYLKNKDYDLAKQTFEEMAQNTSDLYQKRAASGLAAIKEEEAKGK